ncbi:MAG TPA: tetratricopeptide repeat protein [Candidatus Dormibacteraeota bacterium]|nr:tetratricopeptide repeat protein [Candidatus Dormibacteraeota bacterium]
MTTPNNLPAELSSFVGREHQLAELRQLLRKSRLITLTGPGGAGKTRLALRLAAGVLDRYPDGVWLVDLATLNDPRLLDQTVASACGVREEGRRPMVEVLDEWLSKRKTLLILDGCEHLVDASSSLVSRILRLCPKLTILVTSREPLGVPGELIWRTPSLSVPRMEDAGHPELLLASDAVRLYVERAGLGRPGFQLDETAAGPVVQICARLEGMPLAIELAASLSGVMTQEETLDRLHDRFRLLTGGSRTALPRHQTLRAAVDWSYGLLSEPERELLARLSVFAGGFDLAAAEAIAISESIDARAVLPLLSRLVNKSLVVADHGETQRTRYRMLDTIREYAADKLQPEDENYIRRKHCGYYVHWCGRANAELRSHEQVAWLKRMDDEQGNIRLALEWSIAEDTADALRLVGSMDRYWSMRGHLAEALDWLDRALVSSVSDAEPRSLAHLARAHIRWLHGDYQPAQADALVCMDLCRALPLSSTRVTAITLLAILSSGEGDWVSAMHLHEEAFQLAWQLNDPVLIASSLNNLGLIAMERGDHEVARGRLEQALNAFRQAGDRFTIALTLDSLARVNVNLGAHEEARANYMEALTISHHFQDSVNASISLDGLARLETFDGKAQRAVQLSSAAQSLRKGIGIEPVPELKQQIDATLSDAREKLSREVAEAAWRQGAAMNMEEAIRFATGAPASKPGSDGSPLTAREKQVALLIAEGRTNSEIAGRLKMADRTADAHVEHIRNKLGLRTRSQIAVWAHERLVKNPTG